MRFVAIGLVSTSFLTLAACGGGGGSGSVQGLGSVAPPAAVTPTPTTSTPTPTTSTPTPTTSTPTPTPTASAPTPSPTPTPTSALPNIPVVNVGTLTPTPVTPTPSGAHFLDTTAVVTSDAIGGFHSINSEAATTLGGPGGVLYSGNASTIAAPAGTVAYNPRDGIFTLTLADTAAGVSKTLRFQDPAHRTDFNPLRRPYNEVPDFGNFNYLIATEGDDSRATFFYQRPGSVTQYVTLGGFKHRKINDDGSYIVMRGAFAFGAKTPHLQIPINGSGSYAGNFLATMVRSASFDKQDRDSYTQWLSGTSAIKIDFASRAVSFGLNGSVGQTFVNDVLVNDDTLVIKTGSTFSATGSATLDATRDFFTGKFSSAGFTVNGVAVPVNFQSINASNSTAGASSIDGTFYGPNAAEVGGSFRIIGGVPDMRVDILGGFTGKR